MGFYSCCAQVLETDIAADRVFSASEVYWDYKRILVLSSKVWSDLSLFFEILIGDSEAENLNKF
jgi:hypothetical protein